MDKIMNDKIKEVPPTIIHRERNWVYVAQTALWSHYICGVLGIVASCLAATNWDCARIAAVVSATCFGVLGFVQPHRMYHQWMSACRILGDAKSRYEYGLIDLAALLDAADKAERLLQSWDESLLQKPQAANSLSSDKPTTTGAH
jgi:hypothetical protein